VSIKINIEHRMKHIKTYKVFESSENDEVKEYLKDIFLDIQDKDIPVKIESTTGILQSFLKYMKEPLLYKITIGTKNNRLFENTKTFKLEDVIDSIQMAESYMSEQGDINKVFPGNGYFISVIRGGLPKYELGKIGINYGLLYNYNLYKEGKEELFDKQLTYLEIDFKRSK
jgi:hypothetical protein